MAARGVFISQGYIENIGMVDVYHDMDSTKHFFCIDKRGRQRYVSRGRVAFRKGKRK